MPQWFMGKEALAEFRSLGPFDQEHVLRALDHLTHRPGSKVQINLPGPGPDPFAVTALNVIYVPADPENRTLLILALENLRPV